MRVVVHFAENGSVQAVVTDDPCKVFYVCEAAPDDRVYLLTPGEGTHVIGRDRVDEVLGDSPIGGIDDHEKTYAARRLLAGKLPTPGPLGEVVPFKRD